jgi:hypothetical protein
MEIEKARVRVRANDGTQARERERAHLWFGDDEALRDPY